MVGVGRVCHKRMFTHHCIHVGKVAPWLVSDRVGYTTPGKDDKFGRGRSGSLWPALNPPLSVKKVSHGNAPVAPL